MRVFEYDVNQADEPLGDIPTEGRRINQSAYVRTFDHDVITAGVARSDSPVLL